MKVTAEKAFLLLKKRKIKILFVYKRSIMKFDTFPGEITFLTFKLANGSGWLTSHRLIICEHEPGHLEGHAPEVYLLKNFKKAEINGETLMAYFEDKRQAKIHLLAYVPSLPQEIKKYIEQTRNNHSK